MGWHDKFFATATCEWCGAGIQLPEGSVTELNYCPHCKNGTLRSDCPHCGEPVTGEGCMCMKCGKDYRIMPFSTGPWGDMLVDEPDAERRAEITKKSGINWYDAQKEAARDMSEPPGLIKILNPPRA